MTATSDNGKHIKPRRWKKCWIVLGVLLAIVVTLVAAFFIMAKIGEERLRQDLTQVNPPQTDNVIDETALYRDGIAYRYNDRLINLLLIGVDHAVLNEHYKHKQADALYLLSLDTKANTMKIVSISRNTLCNVGVMDTAGNVFGTKHCQICLAYAYGVSEDSAARNTAHAVSDLLYNIPINGYYALYLDTLKELVDLVGGVTATIPDDIPLGPLYDRRGQTVTLNGDDAITFVQTRGESNGPRAQRQLEFIAAFKTAAMKKLQRDISFPIKMLNLLNKNATTNLNLSGMLYLATDALNWSTEFISVPGAYSVLDGLEAYTVDDAALQNFIIDNFYTAS